MLYKCAIPILIGIILLANCSRYPGITTGIPEKKPDQVEAAAQVSIPDSAVIVPQPEIKQARCVYLTFDDGPNSHYTGIILDILKKYGIHASFVVIGNNIEKNQDVFRRIINEGHGVVNHTFSHDYTKIYASPEAFLDDLQHCSQVIAMLTGNSVKIFRAPGGPSKLSKNYYNLLDKHGYKSLGWNVTSADSDPKGATAEQIYNNVVNGVINVEKMNRVPIILMHDGTEINPVPSAPGPALQNYIRTRESDVVALPKIIEFLQARGYTFAVVDDKTPSAW